MIGYLYAIQHGAQIIYDTDDDNAPSDPLKFEDNYAIKEENSEWNFRGLVGSKIHKGKEFHLPFFFF